MPRLPRISDAEWAVMTAVWEAPPRTAQEVAQALAGRPWSQRTVKTLLGRLVKKGVLGFEVDGKRYVYHPRFEREAYARAESREFLERHGGHGGSVSPLLATFVREGELSEAELRELRSLLDEKEGR